MFTISLIARPGALDPALATSLRDAWGGGDVVWLAPDEAAEFTVAKRPDNARDVWESCQGLATDLIIQPSETRRKKMLLADMDSTMIQQECIDELADYVGVGARVKDITARAMNGELDFEAALDERVGLLAGKPASIIQEVLESRITHMPGAKTLLATMKANGAHAALVSGGFTAFTQQIAEDLGFDEHRANTLEIEGATLTGTVARPILGREAKVQALNEITARIGITPADVLAVGDGANDLGMLDAAGAGVAAHAKPSVAAAADHCINHCDLTALLFMQGYARSEFAA